MAELAHNAERDFWRPPVVPPPAALEPNVQSGMVEVCDRCETEFIAGSRFCHVCGAARTQRRPGQATAKDWLRQARSWARHLEFHNVQRWVETLKQRLGLPTGALVSFVI